TAVLVLSSNNLDTVGFPGLTNLVGQILVGGAFTNNNGTNLVRLNGDGSRDTNFQAAVVGVGTNAVMSLDVQRDGRIIVGGAFTNINGTGINRLARLFTNGVLDTSLPVGSGANNPVNAVLVQAVGPSAWDGK